MRVSQVDPASSLMLISKVPAHGNSKKDTGGVGAGDILMFLTGQDEISKAVTALQAGVAELPAGACMDLMVLPIYAALPPELQVRAPPVRNALLKPTPSQT